MPLRDYIGVPYVDKGRDIEHGLDCWGFVRWVYRAEFGIELPDLGDSYSTGRNRDEVAATVAAEIAAHWQEITAPEPGAVVTMSLADRPFHCGISLGDGEFIHNLKPGQDSCIERLRDLRWCNRIDGYYRHVRR